MLSISCLLEPVPGKFLSIIGQDPSDSKSNQLHVDIFRFCFIHLRYTVAYKQLRLKIILKIENKKIENYEVKKTKLE